VVPGIEIYLLPEAWDETKNSYYHLTLHFNDFEAYLEGCKLSKTSYERSVFKGGELKPLVTWDELRSLSGKVTMMSGCMVSPVGRNYVNGHKEISERYFKQIMDIAGKDKFFAEIMPYEVSSNWNKKTQLFEPIPPTECCPSGKLQVDLNKWIFHLARKYDVPVVISEDAHYAHESERFIQEARINKDGKGSWKMSDANCLHSTEWLYNEFLRLHPEETNEASFNQWIDNGEKALETFKGFDAKFSPSLPKVIVNDVELKTVDEHLEYTMNKIIENGRVNLDDPVYSNRLNLEINELYYNGKVNLAPYMLFLTKVVDWCEKNEVLVGPGRGSAAGSLLAYGLKITSVDPIKEDLSFERFFDVTRVEEGLADIDMDFSGRNKVVEYLKNEYGDHFAALGIGTTFKTKSILKDVDRYLHGVIRKETEEVCKKIPHSPQGTTEDEFLNGKTDEEGVYHEGQLETNQFLQKYLEDNPKHKDYLRDMTGIIRQMSVHAAGVLIADRPISDFIPVMKMGEQMATQLLPKWVEKCGGIKFDILGLNTLEDIRLCLKYVKQRHDVDLNPWELPEDPEYWNEIIKDPTSIFQIHTNTVRNGLQTMKPQTTQQVSVLTSVFRPGAMDAVSDEDPNKKMSDIFLDRWTGKRAVKYIHPEMEEILKPTVGILVYQEALMKIANQLGELTKPETNQLRKAISKKEGDALLKLLAKMKTGLLARGWTEYQALSTVNQMKTAGKYIFNKSHGISYSYVAKACAFLKTYFPIEWWSALLSNASKDDLREYWDKIKHITLNPDINLSTDKFIIIKKDDKDWILSPITLIEGVGPSAVNAIMQNRPFKDMKDLITRANLNRGVMFKLILSGTLDSFFSKDSSDLEKMQSYLNAKAEVKGEKPETVPESYWHVTPLKNFLLKKSVFKVYRDDLREVAFPHLLACDVIREKQGVGVYKYNGNDVPILNSTDIDAILDSDREATFAAIAYISDYEEKTFHVTKKFMILSTEIDGKTYEFAKFPDWGSTEHGITSEVDQSVCLVILSKRKDKRDATMKDLFTIEDLSFLNKEKDDEPTGKKKTTRAKRGTKKDSGGVSP
jgi:DNA polymerase-3 subunit alpha